GGSYGLSLSLSLPIFSGFSQQFAVQGAEAQADAAQARADGLKQQVIQQVFTSYYALQTATQQARTAEDLLASATESEQVARGRYREGVGTIIDLLTAQRALADARAQQAQARWTWLNALAKLAHDAGVLSPQGAATIPLAPDTVPGSR
ncbi:MAG TPA: TolC family protein, partial [Longimicrobiales bacterium]|nr:TolC family protein [Longimicrobiales bacterium]